MSLVSVLSIVVRVSFLLLFALVASTFFRRSSALLRKSLLLAALAGSLALLVLSPLGAGRPRVELLPNPVVAQVIAETLMPGAPAPLTGTPAEAGTLAPSSELSLVDWLLLIWVGGSVLWLLKNGYGYWQSAQLTRRASPLEPGVRVSSEIDAPVVVGVFRPSVLLPRTHTGWTPEKRRLVLAHEFSHVTERDGLALLTSQIACAAYWFHPLAWWTSQRLRRELELAADEAVLRTGVRASAYAEVLLALAGGRPTSAGLSMVRQASELGRRVALLLERRTPPAAPSRLARFGVGSAALLMVALIACVTTSSNDTRARETTAPGSKSSDQRLKALVDAEAARVKRQWTAERVSIVVLNPKTGGILAMHDDDPGAGFVPGSTIKPFTIALALDANLIAADQHFDCGNGSRDYESELYGVRTLRDAGSYGHLSTREVLAVSSNVGVSRIFDVLGGERLARGFERFQLGGPASVEGGSIEGAICSIGQRFVTSPVRLSAAYAALANGGVYYEPHVNGTSPGRRVLKPETAGTMLSLLEAVVSDERATGKLARVPGVRVAGKTGTSEWRGTFASFVGMVPAEAPRYVIFVGVGGTNLKGNGGSIAAPAFANLARQVL